MKNSKPFAILAVCLSIALFVLVVVYVRRSEVDANVVVPRGNNAPTEPNEDVAMFREELLKHKR